LFNHNCQTLTCTCQYSTYSPLKSTHFFPIFWNHPDALFKKGLWLAACLHTNQSRSYLNHLLKSGLHSITENIVTIIPKKSKYFILELINRQNNATQHVTPSSRLIINETKSTTAYNSSTQCHSEYIEIHPVRSS
jgi:hypothetical protein